MPITDTVVDGGFYATQYRRPCGVGWTYASWTVFTYSSYYEMYNATQRRVKPDPLTDTALAKQYKRRLKPSVIQYDQLVKNSPWTYYDCSPPKVGTINGMAKGLVDQAMNEPYSTCNPVPDWSSQVLQFVAEEYRNLGSSVAEMKTTAQSFKRFAEGMYNTARELKNLSRFKSKLSFCSVPLAELAYSFGVAPLASDLFNASEALRLRMEQPIYKDFFKTCTAYKTENPSISGFTQVKRKCLVSNRVDARIQLVPKDNTIIYGNPSTWAWELIPFSFVVDWGIPIGQWLLDIDALKLIQGIKGTRTIKVKHVTFFRKTATNYAGVTVVGSQGKTNFQSHERKLVTSVPVPPFPRWKPSLSWHKVYRAMTLLIAVHGCKPVVKPIRRKRPWYTYRDFYRRRS